jgi:chemosensory pili system protein ChpA (sensor histidine kinase/response regulator)
VVAIDSLKGQREIVIKSLGSHLRYVKGISGITIKGDGSLVPIMNLEEFFWRKTDDSSVSISEDGIMKTMPLEIMVVDDSVSIRQVVSRLMEDQGWKVQTAKDGLDALEKLSESKPDLIVLDIEMPRMNGYEFLGALKSQEIYKDIPVVMLTSRNAAKHRNKSKALGARGFVVKPYNDDEFINLVLQLTTESKKENITNFNTGNTASQLSASLIE